MTDNMNFAQQGWQCPICKRVYSPFTPMCYYCGSEAVTKTSTTGTGSFNVDWLKPSSITSAGKENETYTAVCTGTCYGRDTFGAEDIRGEE